MNAVILLTALVAYTQAAPIMNVTETRLSYCEVNVTSIRTTITDVYKTTSNALDALKNSSECEPIVEYDVTMGTNRTVLNDRLNGELQKLIGKLKPLSGLCEDEGVKLYKGEESLITVNVCNVLKCAVNPIPLKLAQYLIAEKCGCTDGCYYVPGKYITFEEVTDLTQIANELRSSVTFLHSILSAILKNEEDIDREEDGSGEDEDGDIDTNTLKSF